MPIIENTARECELTDRLQEAIKAYPNTSAVLVRRHGVYVWGRDWVQAKTQAECYDYLFEAAVRMSQMGIKASQAPAGLHAPQANGAANGIAHNGAGSGLLSLFSCYLGPDFCLGYDIGLPPAVPETSLHMLTTEVVVRGILQGRRSRKQSRGTSLLQSCLILKVKSTTSLSQAAKSPCHCLILQLSSFSTWLVMMWLLLCAMLVSAQKHVQNNSSIHFDLQAKRDAPGIALPHRPVL